MRYKTIISKLPAFFERIEKFRILIEKKKELDSSLEEVNRNEIITIIRENHFFSKEKPQNILYYIHKIRKGIKTTSKIINRNYSLKNEFREIQERADQLPEKDKELFREVFGLWQGVFFEQEHYLKEIINLKETIEKIEKIYLEERKALKKKDFEKYKLLVEKENSILLSLEERKEDWKEISRSFYNFEKNINQIRENSDLKKEEFFEIKKGFFEEYGVPGGIGALTIIYSSSILFGIAISIISEKIIQIISKKISPNGKLIKEIEEIEKKIMNFIF